MKPSPDRFRAFFTGDEMVTISGKDQFHRVVRALAQTGALIAKEERYSEDLQKKDYLASLKGHAARLMGMMDAYEGAR